MIRLCGLLMTESREPYKVNHSAYAQPWQVAVSAQPYWHRLNAYVFFVILIGLGFH